jgi:hypothetical protein
MPISFFSASGQWKSGPLASPEFFPIGVWLQSPGNAAKYKAAGINLYVGLWEGPTEEQLAVLKSAGMPVVCEQNAVGLAHKADPMILGWLQGDEPDNAQEVKDPKTGQTGYGPCIPPSEVVARYERLRNADPSRPVLLNLGQGVANDEWVGRGAGAKLSDYETYVRGGDIVSFDVYPIAGLGKPDGENYLWYVGKGVERLRQWSGGKKTLWTCIECSRISSDRKATPEQVRSEVWMALIQGAQGLVYFVHQFSPVFNEHALLDDPPLLAAVTALNRQIRELAPVLKSPVLEGVVRVAVSPSSVPVAIAVRQYRNALYLFTVGMRNESVQATFELAQSRSSKENRVEVIGEGRILTLRDGQFQDGFRPYEVHLYRIAL